MIACSPIRISHHPLFTTSASLYSRLVASSKLVASSPPSWYQGLGCARSYSGENEYAELKEKWRKEQARDYYHTKIKNNPDKAAALREYRKLRYLALKNDPEWVERQRERERLDYREKKKAQDPEKFARDEEKKKQRALDKERKALERARREREGLPKRGRPFGAPVPPELKEVPEEARKKAEKERHTAYTRERRKSNSENNPGVRERAKERRVAHDDRTKADPEFWAEEKRKKAEMLARYYRIKADPELWAVERRKRTERMLARYYRIKADPELWAEWKRKRAEYLSQPEAQAKRLAHAKASQARLNADPDRKARKVARFKERRETEPEWFEGHKVKVRFWANRLYERMRADPVRHEKHKEMAREKQRIRYARLKEDPIQYEKHLAKCRERARKAKERRLMKEIEGREEAWNKRDDLE